MKWIALALLLTSRIHAADCRACHRAIYDSYQQTGMGRSFAEVHSVPAQAEPFYHAASQRYYQVVTRDGLPYLRRYQPGNTNVIEKRIDFVVGSGNHSRTFLHRAANGKLIELPLSWYAERGGYWAMSPGYDRPDHSDFRREAPDSCLFCHKSYSPGNAIDCARCHGEGDGHGVKRSMETCLQCHLETAGRSVPDAMRRYERAPFSYRAGEPLGDFQIYFEFVKPPADERMTVNGSAYGLMKSACFLRSNGRMTCTTCHNPHARTSAAAVSAACAGCHHDAHAGERKTECVSCHMRKRRTEDAVHVVMTDHHIRRVPARDSLAPVAERHDKATGEVRVSYPPDLPDTVENRMYLAIASGDAVKMERAIAEARPNRGEPYFALGEAYRKAGRREPAARAYQRAIERKPDLVGAYVALSQLRPLESGIALLQRAVERLPNEADLSNALAVLYGRAGRWPDALRLAGDAARIAPDDPLAWFNLSVALAARGDTEGAEAARQNAARLQPELTARGPR